MRTITNSNWGRWIAGWLVIQPFLATGAEAPLTSVAAVRKLTESMAAEHLPVKLRMYFTLN